MEYYSAVRKDEIMPFAATWMGLECHTKQSQKDKYYITYMSKYKWYLYFSKIKCDTNQSNRNASLDITALVTLP